MRVTCDKKRTESDTAHNRFSFLIRQRKLLDKNVIMNKIFKATADSDEEKNIASNSNSLA